MSIDTSECLLTGAVEGFVARGCVHDDGWLALPEWAGDLVRLGGTVAHHAAQKGERSTVALILPTRGFAAVLCAVGAVLQRTSTPPTVEACERFALLSQLPAGTTVTYRTKDSGALFRGILVGCDDESVLLMPSAGATIRIGRHFAHSVEITGHANRNLPEQASSQAPPVPSALLAALLGREEAVDAQSRSRLDCCLVGTSSSLRDEILDTRIGVTSPSGDIVEGPFQDVLHVRSFAGRSGVFHSDVLAASGGASGRAKWADTPHVAVFDGALSFLRNGNRWPDSSRVALLDATNARSADAVSELNREYVQRSGELQFGLSALKSRGCEFLAYRERRP